LIYSVLLVQERGTLILWEDLQKIKIALDKTLIAGMLSALISVSEEVFGSNFHKIEFRNLELTFTKLPDSRVMLGVVSDQGDITTKLFINNIVPQLEEFFKFHPKLVDGSYLPSSELNELSEMIKSQSVRILMPKFGEIKEILEDLYFELLDTKLMDEIAEINYKVELEKEKIIRKISEFDKLVRDAIKKERPRDSRGELKKLIREIYKGDISGVLPALLQYFDLGIYGHIAKLLFVKMSILNRLFPSTENVPSISAIRETLNSVETKKEILVYMKNILNQYLSLLSDEPARYLVSNYSLKAIEHELIVRFDEIDDPLIRDLYAIVAVPLRYDLPNLSMHLAEYFKGKSELLREWCIFLRDIGECRKNIYFKPIPSRIKQVLSKYKDEYIDNYNKLKAKKQMLLSLNTEKMKTLPMDKQIDLSTKLFIHVLKYLKYLYAFIASINSPGFTLDEIENNAKLFRETLPFEKELIVRFIKSFSVSIYFELASAILTVAWTSIVYLPEDDYIEFMKSIKDIINLFLEELFTLNATQHISESIMILDGLEIFDYLSKYYAVINEVNPYIMILLDYLRVLSPEKIDDIKTHDFSSYLLIMSSITHILGYNTFLIKRTVDRIKNLQTIVTLQEPIIHMYLMGGWVHPDLYISILNYHRKIISTTYESKVALDNLHLSFEKAKVLLEYPGVSSFSKVRILNILINSLLEAIQKLEVIPEEIIKKGFKVFDEVIYICENEHGNEQKVAEIVRKRVFLSKFLEEKRKAELVRTD